MRKRKSKSRGFYLNVDGEYVHVQGDKNMSPEELALLDRIVRATRKRLDAQALDDWDNIRVCEVCGDRECVAPATKCHVCRFQEMIDND